MSTKTIECLKLHLVMGKVVKDLSFLSSRGLLSNVSKTTGLFDAAAVEDIIHLSSNKHPRFKANVSKAMLCVHVNNSKE